MRFMVACALLVSALGCGGGGAGAPRVATPTSGPATTATTAVGSTVLVELDQSVGDLAIDATHVYLTLPAEGSVARISRSGGLIERIAEDQPNATHVLVDGDEVYWTIYEEGRGEIRRWSHKPGKWSPVALDSGEIRALSSRGGELIYLIATDSDTKVRAVPQKGGAYRDIAKSDVGSFLAVSDNQVCWGGGFKLWRVGAGGDAQLVSEQFQLLGLAAYGTTIYAWDDAQVSKLIPGEPAEAVTKASLPQVAVTNTYVVIGEGGGEGTMRVRTADGTELPVVDNVTVRLLVADDAAAFWIDGDPANPTLLMHPLPDGKRAASK